MDAEALKQYVFRVWKFRQGAVVSAMIHLGHRLGLYRAMAGGEAISAQELAKAAGVDARLAEEWLRGQAAAGLVEHEDGRFRLGEEGAAVLADDVGSPFFAAAAFTPLDALIEPTVEAFRTGRGFGYDAGGSELAAMMEGMNGPWARLVLPTVVVDGIPGLREKLEAGARVTEIGCGPGDALAALASSYPKSRFVGIDPSRHAVDRTRERIAGMDNAEVIAADATAVPPSDVVLAFDCLHDMSRPDRALAAIRAALDDDGLLVVKDIKTAADFDAQRKNPMLAMMYGMSVLSCLPSAMSEPDGLALGNQGLHPEKLTALAAEAGFSSIAVHDLGDPVNLYYEVRP